MCSENIRCHFIETGRQCVNISNQSYMPLYFREHSLTHRVEKYINKTQITLACFLNVIPILMLCN